MAEFLVLEDAQTFAQSLPAGQIVDDAVFDIVSLQLAGVPVLAYNPATMEAPLTAFLGLAEPRTPGMLLALLVAAGAIGGGGGGGGDVTGPAGSTDNAIARFNGLTGKLLQNSLVTITDLGSIALPGGQTVDGRDVSADGTLLDATAAALTAHIGAGGAAHAAATPSVAGFMSAADKTAHDAVVIEAIRDGDFAGSFPADLARTGAASYVGLRSNLAATVAPTATDDASASYAVGSRWVNTAVTPRRTWLCVDATVGAAVWLELGVGGGGGSAIAGVRDFSVADYMTAGVGDYQGDPAGFSVAVLARQRRRDPPDSVLIHTANNFVNHLGWIVGWSNTNGYYMSIGDGITHAPFFAGPGSAVFANGGKLCLIHGVFDGTNVYTGINGSRAAGGAPQPFAASGIAPTIGRGPFGILEAEFFEILGVAYLDRALTDDEIVDHWSAVAEANEWIDGGVTWTERNGGPLAPGWPSLNGGAAAFTVTGTLADTTVPAVWR